METVDYKFKVQKHVNNLLFFDLFFQFSDKIQIIGELEITPYQTFKAEFSSIYWYFQYTLLKDGVCEILKKDIFEEYFSFFSETDINFEWITIKDDNNYTLNCIDGNWVIETYNKHITGLVQRIID